MTGIKEQRELIKAAPKCGEDCLSVSYLLPDGATRRLESLAMEADEGLCLDAGGQLGFGLLWALRGTRFGLGCAWGFCLGFPC